MAKPVRDPAWKKLVRGLPCCVCGVTRGVQAAHVGLRGLGQIADDHSVIPLCFKHHDRRSKVSIHKLGKGFEEYHHIDIQAILRTLTAKAVIKIESGRFVGRVEDREYLLGPASHKRLKAATQKLRELRIEDLREAS